MLVTLTIIRYPPYRSVFAVLAMAIFRLPLWLHKNNSFYKLMGCGKNGTFDKTPDWQQWAILTATNMDVTNINENILHQQLYGKLIANWLRFFKCETWTIFLTPIEGHGHWDGKMPFGTLQKQTNYDGPIAILTRATIRLSKLTAFWKNVDAVAVQMAGANGFITSVGIGEVPFIKQATFSIWQNKMAMKQFAYAMAEHTAVIQKTRKENWYSEEMFVRFIPIKTIGTIKGSNPLQGML
jgi:hypothetical protein